MPVIGSRSLSVVPKDTSRSTLPRLRVPVAAAFIVAMTAMKASRIIAWTVSACFLAAGVLGVMQGRATPVQDMRTVEVHGVVGSEKKAFFNDPEVRRIFARHGLDVKVETSDSWEMSDRSGIEHEDFAFPSSDISADSARRTPKNWRESRR